MAKRKNVNETVKAYRKERKRVQQAKRRLEKRGYIVPEIPAIPKKITRASVRRLGRITIDMLYKKAIYVDVETGEIIAGEKRRKEERKERSRKGQITRKAKANDEGTRRRYTNAKNTSKKRKDKINTDPNFFTRTVIYNWKQELAQFSHGEFSDLLLAWLNQIITENGEENTAIMLQDASENGVILTWEVAYNEGEMQRYIASLVDYLPDQGVLYKEEQLDKLDYMKRLNDAFDENESWETYD